MIEFVGARPVRLWGQTCWSTPLTALGSWARAALEFKLRYPAMYTCYRMVCLEQELKPGGLLVWRSCTGWVVSLATKDDWRAPSSYAWVAACLAALRDLSCPVSGGYVRPAHLQVRQRWA